ncbi:hypothetical protein PHLGIDRAFT_398821 [Phlebiopsis gigantea 11061_1 CR5-6]|uniref:Uncharacterized protein n=1 Tax=Phlebiopsis gigantea (strain 11061_1 CR5-6) TaxID=745531 RepID=A0A0C3PVS7_PHLG1|nr:hypothetical protein PHLGIDRAFT_398821 [Phlebiopsis gigantea 11061_1 CR5-6]
MPCNNLASITHAVACPGTRLRESYRTRDCRSARCQAHTWVLLPAALPQTQSGKAMSANTCSHDRNVRPMNDAKCNLRVSINVRPTVTSVDRPLQNMCIFRGLRIHQSPKCSMYDCTGNVGNQESARCDRFLHAQLLKPTPRVAEPFRESRIPSPDNITNRELFETMARSQSSPLKCLPFNGHSAVPAVRSDQLHVQKYTQKTHNGLGD